MTPNSITGMELGSAKGQLVSGFLARLFILMHVVLGLSFAEEAGGGLPGYFLSQGAGARALGMGRAFVAVADDPSAMYWNPGGLFQLEQKELSFMHVILFENARYNFAGYVHAEPAFDPFTFGVGVAQLYAGGLVKRDSLNNPGEEFADTQTAWLVSAGYRPSVDSGFGVGLTAKLLNKQMDTASTSGLDFDAGLLIRPWDFLRLGVAAQNLLGAQLSRDGGTEQLPLSATFALALFLPGTDVMVAGAADYSKDRPWRMHGSVEYLGLKDLALRGGYDQGRLIGGVGFRQGWLGLDYALTSHAELGLSHRASLGVRFGSSRLEARARIMVAALWDKVETDLKRKDWQSAMDRLATLSDFEVAHEDAEKKLIEVKELKLRSERHQVKVKEGLEKLSASSWRRWAEASKLFREVLREDPANEEAAGFLAKAKAKLGAAKPHIAVGDLEAKEVSPNVAQIVRDYLSNELVNARRFEVIERSRMEEVLKEQAFQKSGCTTQECAVEIGKLLNSEFMIIGSVNKLGSTYSLSVRVVDVEKATTVFSTIVDRDSESALRGACQEAASALVKEMLEE